MADDEGFGVDAVGALTAAVPEHAARVAAAIDQVVGPTDIARIFSRRQIDLAFDRLCGERWTGSEMPDLSQFFLLRPVEKTDSTQLEAMVGDLTTLPYIESVYFEGRSAPPTIGGAATAQKLETFENLQGYLGPAPWGIDARFAWTRPGGTGAHARVWDIEIGWNLNHEDLPAPFMLLGTPGAVPKWTRHGTAVLGILGARLNGIGVVGIARDATFGLSASDEENATVPAAINLALANSLPYDIILIERQIAGPLIQVQEPGETCGEFSSGRAMVAAEYDDAVFAAIQVAVANRRVVVESAGNGASDLGGPEFVGRYDPGSAYFLDSGAIMVGARESATRLASCLTNHGARIDVSAWGDSVTTTGWLGRLTPDENADSNRNYDDDFGGTSAAAAIVAGAAALIQSAQIGRSGAPFGPEQMRTILRTFGTDQEGGSSRRVGRMPSVKWALEWMVEDADKDGMANADELAKGRNPYVNEAAVLITLLPTMED